MTAPWPQAKRDQLCSLYNQFGPKWKTISSEMGTNPSSIRSQAYKLGLLTSPSANRAAPIREETGRDREFNIEQFILQDAKFKRALLRAINNGTERRELLCGIFNRTL
jgi:hypothetical protein